MGSPLAVMTPHTIRVAHIGLVPLTSELCTQACQEHSQAVLPQGFNTVVILHHEPAGRYTQPQGRFLGEVPQPLACERSGRNMTGIVQEAKDERKNLQRVPVRSNIRSRLLDAVPFLKMHRVIPEAVAVWRAVQRRTSSVLVATLESMQ